MFLKNQNGRIIAEIKFTAGLLTNSESQETTSRGSSLFRTLRAIPRDILKADIRYFGIGFDSFVPLTTYAGKSIMDIQSALNDSEERASNVASEKQPSKMLFVAPATTTSPDDGVLTYSTVVTIFDVANVPDRAVVLFTEEQLPLLKCLCENSALFDLELRALSGLPETDYSSEFDSVTWALDRVAYLPFLSELRLAAEIDEQLAAQEATAHDREKAQYTRKSGEVKAHTGFDLAVPEGEGVTADDSEIL